MPRKRIFMNTGLLTRFSGYSRVLAGEGARPT